MAILDLQRRLAEVGRIRIGQQVPTSSGKTRPAKLDTFRLTSGDRARVEAAARLYGGTVEPWQSPAGQQWEVITKTDALQVMVPPSDMAFSQYYELWSAGGCQRRCDGHTEQITDGPCLCDPDNRECDIHTRLSVMLRDLPGLGVWRIDTQGYYAAVELQGAVEVIQLAAGAGAMLPARLFLAQRQVKRPGPDGKVQTRNFAVPILDVEVTPAQLMAGIGASNGGVTPVPELPARSIREQAADVNQRPAVVPRRNAAAVLPATGVEPRTAEDVSHMKNVDVLLIAGKLHDLGVEDRREQLTVVSRIVGRELGSASDLTDDEVTAVLDEVRSVESVDDLPKGDG